MRIVVLFIIALLITHTPLQAQERAGKHLTTDDINRVKAFKVLIADVDAKPLTQTIKELEKSQHPHLALLIKESMARTYAQIVQDQNVQGQKKKEWLYSMVALNMAYLQFDGAKDSAGNTEPLNKLIRYKLKKNLPDGTLQQPGFHYAID